MQTNNDLNKCKTTTVLNAGKERSMLLREYRVGCLTCSGKERKIFLLKQYLSCIRWISKS